ncbi:HET-domain-containing protein [Aulographum hederae CBS 113979]|uniref:HET-domain-containing protein n=1 Tax=Aulographum hederae CBS 113979 TaxID=1176131 RepID=A0A6G1GNN1_9PEZI|nr:HET-domain-containing protein [Aulographum hederae CBS 113979]
MPFQDLKQTLSEALKHVKESTSLLLKSKRAVLRRPRNSSLSGDSIESESEGLRELVIRQNSSQLPVALTRLDEETLLCETCNGLRNRNLERAFNFGFVRDIIHGSRGNCSFCRMLLTGLDLDRLTVLQPDSPHYQVEIRRQGTNLHVTTIKVFHLGTSDGDESDLSIHRSSSIRERKVSSRTFPLKEESDRSTDYLWNMDQPEAFRTANGWLSECVINHDCGSGGEEAFMPSRVIFVSGSDRNHLRLVIPAEDSTHRGKYVALSYCWGTAVPFITTPTTLSDRIEGFSMDDLPRTLRDAVRVTRELGCDYLWVDAICILQGTDEAAKADWLKESAAMKSVYRNSLVTIIAAGSGDCDGGLFYPRHCQLQLRDQSMVDGSFRTMRVMRVLPPLESDHTRQHKDEPINSRAWALQERLLSRRNLLFCLNEIAWQCEHGSKREKTTYDFRDRWHRIFTYRIPPDPESKNFRMISQNYCSRNMTNPGDKLPALSGLAQQFHSVTGERYYAGLWESTLLFDLLWVRDDGFRTFFAAATVGVPTVYRAPSWSWASRDNNIVHTPTNGAKLTSAVAKVVDCDTTPATADKFGAVSDGYVIVEAPFRRAGRIAFDGGVPVIFPEDVNSKKLGNLWLDEGDKLDEDSDVLQREVFCLLFLAYIPHHFGLVLTPSADKTGCYTRLGVFVASDDEQKPWFEGGDVQAVTIV